MIFTEKNINQRKNQKANNRKMNREKIYKKEIKKINNLLEKGYNKKSYDGYREYTDILKILGCDSFQRYVSKIEGCVEALKIIDDSKVKELHLSKACPVFAKYFGLNFKSSKEFEKFGIKNNKEAIKILELGNFLEYMMNFENNKKDASLEAKIEEMANMIKINSVEKTEFDVDEIKNYIEQFLIRNAMALTNVLEKMKSKEVEFGLIEEFSSIMEMRNSLKEILGISKTFYKKENDKEKVLTDEDIYKIALKYTKRELEHIVEKLKEPLILGEQNFRDVFFKDKNLGYYELVKNFIDKNSSYIDKKDFKDYCEKIEVIEEEKENFREYIISKWDTVIEEAEKAAKEGDKNYKKNLKNFMIITTIYSKILGEDVEEINEMWNVFEPDLHVEINNKVNRVALYDFYKTFPEDSAALPRMVLDIELKYLRSKRNGEEQDK